MKRLVAVLIVTVVILGVVSGFLFYQSYNLVRIKGLLKYGWDNPGGLLMVSTVNVTIENFGVNTVSGLSLLIEDVSDFQTGNWSDNETIQIEPVKPGEIRTISTNIEWSLGSNGNTTATLMLDNKIIDEFTIYR
jgi:hypothetical protein